MLTANDLEARARRLSGLALGLAREASLVRRADDPLLRAERLDYLAGVQDALSGCERARVTLARALTRMRDEDEKRGARR